MSVLWLILSIICLKMVELSLKNDVPTVVRIWEEVAARSRYRRGSEVPMEIVPGRKEWDRARASPMTYAAGRQGTTGSSLFSFLNTLLLLRLHFFFLSSSGTLFLSVREAVVETGPGPRCISWRKLHYCVITAPAIAFSTPLIKLKEPIRSLSWSPSEYSR